MTAPHLPKPIMSAAFKASVATPWLQSRLTHQHRKHQRARDHSAVSSGASNRALRSWRRCPNPHPRACAAARRALYCRVEENEIAALFGYIQAGIDPTDGGFGTLGDGGMVRQRRLKPAGTGSHSFGR
jgi:hypothetical protein